MKQPIGISVSQDKIDLYEKIKGVAVRINKKPLTRKAALELGLLLIRNSQ